LGKQYDLQTILANQDNFVVITERDSLLACAEVKYVQWYQSEICHVSVSEGAEGKGYGSQILLLAEAKAIKQGASGLQCTIRSNNSSSIRLFDSKGYTKTVSFVNKKTGNWVHVFQKSISVNL